MVAYFAILRYPGLDIEGEFGDIYLYDLVESQKELPLELLPPNFYSDKIPNNGLIVINYTRGLEYIIIDVLRFNMDSTEVTYPKVLEKIREYKLDYIIDGK